VAGTAAATQEAAKSFGVDCVLIDDPAMPPSATGDWRNVRACHRTRHRQVLSAKQRI